MKSPFFSLDLKLFMPVLALLFISLTILFSINGDIFRSQLLFGVIAVIIYILCSQINYNSLALYEVPIYLGSLFVLFIVLILGFQSHGAVRWVTVFGKGIQFSEICKPLLAISLAAFLANKQSTSLKTLLMVFGLLAPIGFLIYRQPDLGNALIYLATTILTLILYGFPLRYFIISGAAILAAVPLLWQFLHSYQKERLLTFLHLTNDPLGISYNAIQSVIAVGSGQLFGKGLGQGTQSGLRFLPERHTDFLFATLSEELGLLGGIIIILAFVFLFWRMYEIYKNTDDLFGKLFVGTAFSLLFLQFFINIGMNIGMLPIVGVTLPFVSYGGSSLVSNAIFLGIVAAIGRAQEKKHVLEIA